MLENFACFVLVEIFSINFSKKFFREYRQSVKHQTVLDPDQALPKEHIGHQS